MTKISELDSCEEEEASHVRKWAKSMLKNHLFVGDFKEKRFVEPLNDYRDLIKVSEDETKFIQNLCAVRKRCIKHFNENMWIGMTEPKTVGAPVGYNLWVSLDKNIFGSYWYQVKNVDFRTNEICLQLEVVRCCTPKKKTFNSSVRNDTETSFAEDISEIAFGISSSFREKIKVLFNDVLTAPNIWEVSKFLCILLMTVTVAFFHTIKYLLEYILQLLDRLTKIIQVLTPTFQHVTDLFAKIVMFVFSGLFTLIALLFTRTPRFTDNNATYRQLPVNRMQPQIQYYPNAHDQYTNSRNNRWVKM